MNTDVDYNNLGYDREIDFGLIGSSLESQIRIDALNRLQDRVGLRRFTADELRMIMDWVIKDIEPDTSLTQEENEKALAFIHTFKVHSYVVRELSSQFREIYPNVTDREVAHLIGHTFMSLEATCLKHGEPVFLKVANSLKPERDTMRKMLMNCMYSKDDTKISKFFDQILDMGSSFRWFSFDQVKYYVTCVSMFLRRSVEELDMGYHLEDLTVWNYKDKDLAIHYRGGNKKIVLPDKIIRDTLQKYIEGERIDLGVDVIEKL